MRSHFFALAVLLFAARCRHIRSRLMIRNDALCKREKHLCSGMAIKQDLKWVPSQVIIKATTILKLKSA